MVQRKNPDSTARKTKQCLAVFGAQETEDLGLTVCEVEVVMFYREPKREGPVEHSRGPIEFSAKNWLSPAHGKAQGNDIITQRTAENKSKKSHKVMNGTCSYPLNVCVGGIKLKYFTYCKLT